MGNEDQFKRMVRKCREAGGARGGFDATEVGRTQSGGSSDRSLAHALVFALSPDLDAQATNNVAQAPRAFQANPALRT